MDASGILSIVLCSMLYSRNMATIIRNNSIIDEFNSIDESLKHEICAMIKKINPDSVNLQDQQVQLRSMCDGLISNHRELPINSAIDGRGVDPDTENEDESLSTVWISSMLPNVIGSVTSPSTTQGDPTLMEKLNLADWIYPRSQGEEGISPKNSETLIDETSKDAGLDLNSTRRSMTEDREFAEPEDPMEAMSNIDDSKLEDDAYAERLLASVGTGMDDDLTTEDNSQTFEDDRPEETPRDISSTYWKKRKNKPCPVCRRRSSKSTIDDTNNQIYGKYAYSTSEPNDDTNNRIYDKLTYSTLEPNDEVKVTLQSLEEICVKCATMRRSEIRGPSFSTFPTEITTTESFSESEEFTDEFYIPTNEPSPDCSICKFPTTNEIITTMPTPTSRRSGEPRTASTFLGTGQDDESGRYTTDVTIGSSEIDKSGEFTESSVTWATEPTTYTMFPETTTVYGSDESITALDSAAFTTFATTLTTDEQDHFLDESTADFATKDYPELERIQGSKSRKPCSKRTTAESPIKDVEYISDLRISSKQPCRKRPSTPTETRTSTTSPSDFETELSTLRTDSSTELTYSDDVEPTRTCGSLSTPRFKLDGATTRPNSSTPLKCNLEKMVVRPKYPRKSRRNTKILSAVGKLHSYAGFFETNQEDKTRLFFWFFCNQKWKNTPLIVWLQGEPGLTSMYGLFEEHGPYYLQPTADGIDIKLRQFSWAKEYNVLYLDHCIGCGFSSSKNEQSYIASYANVAANVYESLSQFFGIWHEMLPSDLYLAGSYGAAKYIPVIAHKIHSDKVSTTMNLKGIMIGGGYMDSATMVNYNDILHGYGIIDETTYDDLIPSQNYAKELIRAGNYREAADFLKDNVYCMFSLAGYEIYDDLRFMKSPLTTFIENTPELISSEKFRKMVCVDNVDFHVDPDILIEEIMPSVDNLLPELITHYKVLFYNGQFDLMAPYTLTSKALSQLEWQWIDHFYTSKMTQWCPSRSINSCPFGYFKNYKNLTHVMIRNAGHAVGSTNPEGLFHLLKWFVEDKFEMGDSDEWSNW